MQVVKHSPNGLIPAFFLARRTAQPPTVALAMLPAILLAFTLWLAAMIPCRAQSQAQEVEFASTPAQARREEPREATRPSQRTSARINAKRAAAPQPPASTVPEEVVAPALPPEPELPDWRIICQKLLTPFGINTALIRFGMSGPAVDILGCIILLILALLLLVLGAFGFQAIRYQITERMQRKQIAQLQQKTEPRMPTRIKQNAHGSANSRHKPDQRTSANSRHGIDSQNGHSGSNGSHGRAGPETRSAPNSRIVAPNTRTGPDSRLDVNTRSGPASRIFPETRNGPAMNTLTATASMFIPETPGMNPVLHKNDIQNTPPEFDQARFLRKTRVYFLRLQAAWDKSDVNIIRQFAAGPVFNEMRKQIMERGDSTNTTNVLSIQTELLGIEIIDGNYIARVKFNGMIKETSEPAEAAFEEIWRLSMPADKQGDWVLSGIAQSVLK